jgi:hypothetical protein
VHATAKQKIDQVKDLIRQTSPEVLLRASSLCDGHTILAPKAFLEAGLPAEVVDFATSSYKSDGSPKGTIFVKGQPVKELTGVYGLDLLELIARSLSLQYRSCMGRGFQAQAIQQALHQHLAARKPT